MRQAVRASRGFTLVELMAVVAIVGALSALSVVSLTSIANTGRVNGAATALARQLANARTRAMVERCRYLVQVTGPAWAPGTANQAGYKSTAFTIRKANCASASGFYEVGDNVVSEFVYNESNSAVGVNLVTQPSGVVSGDQLANNAVSFSWGPDGARSIYVDGGGSASWTLDGTASTVAFQFIVVSTTTNLAQVGLPPPTGITQRAVNVPVGGAATAP